MRYAAAPSPTPPRRPPSSFGPKTHFPLLGVPDAAAQGHAVAAAAAARRRPGNRYNPHPATGDPDYDPEQAEVLKALAVYRQEHHLAFTVATDVFRVMKGMGYVKVPHGFRLVPIDAPEPAPPPVPPLRLHRPD
jgi:hypothetical protein